MPFSALFLIAALAAQLPPPTQAPLATVEGRVLALGTNEPIESAQVTLVRTAGPGGAAPGAPPVSAAAPIPPVRTDREGKFVLKDVPAGSYRLAAARNNFIGQEFGQRSAGRPGTVIDLTAGRSMRDVVLRLIPAATISGRVTDERGEPLPNIGVQLLRSVYDATGKRSLQQAKGATTDDRGEYRLFFLAPGRYYVSASPPADTSATRAQVQAALAAQTGGNLTAAQRAALDQIAAAPPATVESLESGYVPTFYPGVLEPGQALPVEVQAGLSIPSIDFKLIRPLRFRLRGRVIDGANGQPPTGATIQMIPANTTAASRVQAATGYDSSTGNFEIRDVTPGDYLVIAVDLSSLSTGQAVNQRIATTKVTVGNSDLENVVATIAPGISISGRLSFDGPAPLTAQGFAGVGVGLLPATEPAVGLPPRALSIGQDGSFTMNNVPPGTFRVNLSGVPAGAYLKSARYGSSDASREPLTATDRPAGALEILIGLNAGEITGTVVDRDLKPVNNVQAVLVPETNRDRRDLFKVANSDEAGRFTLRGIPPGEYRILAWEDIEPFAYFDADVLRQYEQLGKTVSVLEASKLQLEVRAIPATQQ